MSTKQLIVILSALIIVVLLYLLPTKSTQEVKTELSKEEMLNQKINEALNIIQTQPMPMPGIKLLKEVLQEDPKNERALELLSQMSLKTGQHEKALGYLVRLAEVKPSREVASQLGSTYLALKDTVKAKSIFVKLYETATDSLQKQSMLQLIEQIK